MKRGLPAWLLALAAAALGGLVAALVLTVGTDASNERQVSDDGGGAGHVHSHDGEEITNILLTDPQGGEPRLVTTTHGHGATVSAPAWSPSGDQLAFGLAPCHGCAMKINVVAAPEPGEDPGEARPLGGGFNPDWSPDGRSLVYVGAQGGIYTMSADGSDKRLILGGAASFDEPTWSASNRIAFLKQERNGAWHVYTMQPDGSDVSRLTRGKESEANPAWSPDGMRLAFARQLKLRWVLHVVDAAGGRGNPVFRGRTSDTSPTWAPDGSQLAFVRQDVDKLSLAVVAVEGGSPSPVLGTGPRAAQPAWSPDGRRIAFVGPGVG